MLHDRRYCVIFLLLICGVFLSAPVLGAEKRPLHALPTHATPRATVPASPTPAPSPFAAGERLTFSAFFNALPAGDGEFLLRRERQADGIEAFRFIGQARTNELIDVLYKRRDSAEAVFGLRDYLPGSFRLLSREGSRRREYTVRYDPDTKTLRGSAKKRKRTSEQSLVATNVYDPVSALYLLRSRELVPGKPIAVTLFTGKGRYRFVAQVVKRETVLVNNQEHQALRLRPQIFSLDKNLAKNILPEETNFWVSADALHTPLKLESATTWGWITVELKKYEVTTKERVQVAVTE
ncbi:MAG: DUF3108 domain-containing protein [Candidatus Binatia bacterium]